MLLLQLPSCMRLCLNMAGRCCRWVEGDICGLAKLTTLLIKEEQL